VFGSTCVDEIGLTMTFAHEVHTFFSMATSILCGLRIPSYRVFQRK
jgi:hypothetical protein